MTTPKYRGAEEVRRLEEQLEEDERRRREYDRQVQLEADAEFDELAQRRAAR